MPNIDNLVELRRKNSIAFDQLFLGQNPLEYEEYASNQKKYSELKNDLIQGLKRDHDLNEKQEELLGKFDALYLLREEGDLKADITKTILAIPLTESKKRLGGLITSTSNRDNKDIRSDANEAITNLLDNKLTQYDDDQKIKINNFLNVDQFFRDPTRAQNITNEFNSYLEKPTLASKNIVTAYASQSHVNGQDALQQAIAKKGPPPPPPPRNTPPPIPTAGQIVENANTATMPAPPPIPTAPPRGTTQAVANVATQIGVAITGTLAEQAAKQRARLKPSTQNIQQDTKPPSELERKLATRREKEGLER